MILIIGDQHFKQDNEVQCRQHFEQVKSILEEGQVTHVVTLGDMSHYHEKIYASCINFIHEYIQMISAIVPLTILVGNHDMKNNQVFCDPDGHWMKILKRDRVTIVDQPKIFEIDGMKIAMLPYVFPGRFKEALDTFGVDLNKVDYCFCHQEFKGCQMGAIKSINGDEYEWNTKCISGHVHSFQTLGKILYTGAAFEHSFGSAKCFLFFLNKKELRKIPSKVFSKTIEHCSIVDGRLSRQLPENSNPRRVKCVVKANSTEDYRAWLASEEGRTISKLVTLELLQESTIEESRGDGKQKTVLGVFCEKITKNHPDCLDLMNSLI